MKKYYYTVNDVERCMITISSEATVDNFEETLVYETGGLTCGPADDLDEELENYIRENWGHFEQMTEEEEDEWLDCLAERWGLTADDLDYLK